MATKLKKPKFPTRAVIGPVEWQIVETDLSKRGIYGSCTPVADHTIKIDTSIDRYETLLTDTVIHEILHALSDTYRIKLKERQVWQLGVALSHFLPRNPHITHWIEQYDDWLEEQD
jgi:hypothetical protein